MHKKLFENFVKVFMESAFFVQTHKNVTHDLVNFEESMLTNPFYQFFVRKRLKIFETFFKNFLQIAFFVQNAQKLNPCLVKFWENYAKIMHFLHICSFAYFLKIFWIFLKIFWNVLKILWYLFWKSGPRKNHGSANDYLYLIKKILEKSKTMRPFSNCFLRYIGL